MSINFNNKFNNKKIENMFTFVAFNGIMKLLLENCKKFPIIGIAGI